MSKEVVRPIRPSRRVSGRSFEVLPAAFVAALAIACSANGAGDGAGGNLGVENVGSTSTVAQLLPEATHVSDQVEITDESQKAEIGRRAPDFKLTRADGADFRLSEILGKRPIVMTVGCSDEDSHITFEDELRVREALGGGFVILAVNLYGYGNAAEGITVLNVTPRQQIGAPLKFDRDSGDFVQKFEGICPSAFYINTDGILFAKRLDPINRTLAKVLLSYDLPYDVDRAPHFLPFELDSRFSTINSFEVNADLLRRDVAEAELSLIDSAGVVSDNPNALEIYEALEKMQDLLEDAKSNNGTVQRQLRDFNDSKSAEKFLYREIDSLLKMGQVAKEGFCQTQDPIFGPLVEASAALAYREVEREIEIGRLPANIWQMEQMFRHFTTNCPTP